MTKEKYLSLCEQMNTQPDEDKCPPGYEDFPEPVQQAVEAFNKLGDRVYPDIGYMGKDFTSLDLFIEVLGVAQKEIFLETLVRLDAFMIKKSAEQLKKARDSVKKKGNGK